ncbi:hypothetical protein CEXT_532681 [Caerostris extrusa]|uniref:Uncharacterized protein n=1 Tax=Caerostris extrusa TaxID=172846 RepID=A0AAV4QVU0_CAEEX|nr:hypothetical protein CEXT_532681 [Caerostris extrusa]
MDGRKERRMYERMERRRGGRKEGWIDGRKERRMEGKKEGRKYIPVHEKFCLITSITCGIIGGSLSTYASIIDIVQTVSFQPPCYVNLTAASNL